MPLVSFVPSKTDVALLVQEVANFDSQQVDNKRNIIGLF